MASSAILHLLVDDMLRMVSHTSCQQEDVDEAKAKRYGRYFPSRMSFEANWGSDVADDDESTWEFTAPMAPSRSSSSSGSTSSTCYTAFSSPAQEIAFRYRAGMPLDFEDSRSRSSTTVCSEGEDYSDCDLSWDATTSTSSSLAPSTENSLIPDDDIPYYKRELRAIFRQSRHEALQHNWNEARAQWKLSGRKEHESLECHRPGCGNIVPNVRAMAYHLHIHDISDMQCTRRVDPTIKCECCLNSTKGLVYGNCQTSKQKSNVSNPLWANLRRAITKIKFKPSVLSA
ncbi:hypothetical protein AX16_007362 [Volvariella volvacea WC 439]|nr:hypothetical protein AX16_007362 [Volvariella volvacea WC 439]